jgi:hypothetical protein
MSSQSVSTSVYLVTALNNGYSSAVFSLDVFLVANLSTGDSSSSVTRCLILHSWTLNCLVAPIVFKITPRHGPHWKHRILLRICSELRCLAMGMARAHIEHTLQHLFYFIVFKHLFALIYSPQTMLSSTMQFIYFLLYFHDKFRSYMAIIRCSCAKNSFTVFISHFLYHI